MIGTHTPEVEALFRGACRHLMAPAEREGRTVLDREGIQGLLPHRDPFLLIDRITWLDGEQGLITGTYDLRGAEAVLAGHFPGASVWPGVLQVEAVAQVGLVLVRSLAPPEQASTAIALTQILGAQFMKPVVPGAEVEVVARIVEDGLFIVIIGQCLQNGQICSAAAVRGL